MDHKMISEPGSLVYGIMLECKCSRCRKSVTRDTLGKDLDQLATLLDLLFFDNL